MAFRAATTNGSPTTSSTTPSVAVPAGVQAGDIVLLVYAIDTGSLGVTLPTGFTALDSLAGFGPDGQAAQIAWKSLTGADTGSYAYTGAVIHNWAVAACAFSGRDTGNPPTAGTRVSNSTGAASPISVAATGVTALLGDDLAFVVAPDTTAAVATTLTPPGGYTNQATSSFGLANVNVATLDNVSAGATGTVTGSFSFASGTAGYVGWLVRLPLGSGGGGGPVASLFSVSDPGDYRIPGIH